MKRSGAAPCQCHSPGGVWTVSPARTSRTSPPRACVRPTPSVTWNVWPTGWACHALRAPGAKCTTLARTRDGSSPRTSRSNHASPMNRSSGPLLVGCFGWICISFLRVPVELALDLKTDSHHGQTGTDPSTSTGASHVTRPGAVLLRLARAPEGRAGGHREGLRDRGHLLAQRGDPCDIHPWGCLKVVRQ